MDTYKLRKACVSMGVVILFVIFSTSNAFSWGSATHAYIDDKIGKKLPFDNLNEIYGGMAADIFNFYPDVLVGGTAHNYLYIQTHYNSLALWAEAQSATELGKASAFGFASHANGQLWGPFAYIYAGADSTAHGPDGNTPGFYVIEKATDFWEHTLKPMGIIQDDATGLSISHNIIEFAIDIMVVYEIPNGARIGKKMIDSALLRTPGFPILLVKTYAQGLSTLPPGMSRLEAAKMIISAERDFRKTIMIYGQGLVQKDESDAIKYVASLLTQLAYEIYEIQVEQGMVEDAISLAQFLCRDDYKPAIQGTINYVNTQMTGAEISY